MCILYPLSFLLALGGFFGVGHLLVGAMSKAALYFMMGLLWTVFALFATSSSGFLLAICLLPLHLLFAHFCAADAVRHARRHRRPTGRPSAALRTPKA